MSAVRRSSFSGDKRTSVEELAYTPIEEVEGIKHAVDAAFRSGKTRDVEWRRRQLENLRSLVSENAELIVDAIHQDVGRPRSEGRLGDVMTVIREVDYALSHMDRWVKPRATGTPLLLQPATSEVQSEPLGTVLVIGAWNFPFLLLLGPLVGIISAGNCAVCKPSEVSPHSARLIGELIPGYLDQECFRVVQGGVSETTELLKHPWDHIMYTGNGHVGRIVMRAAAEHLTPVTLELGGKCPALVDSTASLDIAARRIVNGKFMNCGQVCLSTDYVLVARGMKQRLVDALGKTLRQFYGETPGDSTHFGRIVNRRHFDRVSALVDGDHGGEVIQYGTRDPETLRFPPTIIVEPNPESPVMQEEIFGPVLLVLEKESVDAMIGFVNARPKPLALYLFSETYSVQQAVRHRTSSGALAINDTVMQQVSCSLPFGGVGASGMGNYHGYYGFQTFSHQKAVLTKSSSALLDAPIRYPPYSDQNDKIAMALGTRMRFSMRTLAKVAILGAALSSAAAYYWFLQDPE